MERLFRKMGSGKSKVLDELEKDFYERTISVIKSTKSENCYIISERDPIKGLRVTVYDTERGIVLRDYKCRS